MDCDRNAIPSSEDTEAEIIPCNIEEINEAISTDVENDCRINCTDNKSLRNIFDIVLDQVKDLADSCNLKDSNPDFVAVFRESFKNALQENILVNGLPLMVDENQKLSPTEKEEHLHMVDDELFSKLSKKVAQVAQERKFFPGQCCRIVNIEMKHELQNLKKAKVIDSSAPSTSSLKSSNIDKNNLRMFSEFCQGFSTMQETVRCKIQEKEKLAMKLNLVTEIQKSQKRAKLDP